MSATTPGPWQLSEKLGGPHPALPHLEYFHVLGPEGDWDLNLNIAGYMRRADANLIAASPMMYATLREIERLRLATDEGTCARRFDRAWEIARAAIATAEGQS